MADYRDQPLKIMPLSTLTLIELALTLLPKVTVGVTQLVSWISTLRVAAKQDGEWSDEYESAWRAGLLSQNLDPAEIPDP